MTNTTPASIGADAVREALKWAAAALQAIAPDEDTVRDNATGETRSVGQILDAADAALASAAQPVAVPHAQMTEEIDNILSDPDTRLSPGAERALSWLRTWTDAPLVLAAAPKAAPARWYMINAVGMATLCADKQDAEQEAADAQAAWPHAGPHRAVQMREVAAAPAPAAQGDALDAREFWS